jgi:hypothetical protein
MNTWILSALLLTQLPPGGPPVAVPTCARPVLPADAARRAVALGFLSSRAWLEIGLSGSKKADTIKELQLRKKNLASRAQALGVLTVMTQKEAALFQAPLGSWERAQVQDVSWAMEGAGTLLWALGVVDTLPGPGAPLSMDVALRPIMPTGAAETLLKSPRLRPGAELGRAWGEAELFAWRAGMDVARRKAKANTLEDSTRATLQRALAAGLTSRHVEGDLLSGATPVSRLDGRGLGTLVSSARARANALRWVCGER